ncbi:monovalent cation/H(+) antiporter subunit G [Phyllobacterium leguminum]|uniref:Multisubunit potassium/proton antiporter PhaG subunit n=1 Tax=Phyllobacterium leguminum TaxID=314237 RepID=A0A318TLY2_9HYPH|nr:monovalent cation/H(+) antiporter subunit G [Phyllobacterium leguminum]PYE90516.1 multisubunit potassium/proton antiporter PhaG subunit [Phyllobacterium leguminum]
MNDVAGLPLWAALLISLLLLAGAAFMLMGAIGLLRFKTFYERLHAPAMGTSLGAGGVLTASIIFFSARDGRLALHDVLLGIFIMITTPVTLMLLTRAALHRDPPEKRARVRKRRKRSG